MNHIKAQRREKKKLPKMAVHGRGVKSQPSQGIPKAAKRSLKMVALCFNVLMFLCFNVVLAQAQSEPPSQLLVAQAPQLFIVSPAPGEVITASQVKVNIVLPKNFVLVDPKVNSNNQEGQGHLHLWLDSQVGDNQDAGVILTSTPEYIYEKVFSGLHTLNAEFLHNDNTSYTPRIFTTVNFETITDDSSPIPGANDNEISVPVDLSAVSAGLFLPHGGGNSILAVIIVFIVSGILWYVFGGKRKK